MPTIIVVIFVIYFKGIMPNFDFNSDLMFSY